ncbi:MAG: phosphotransferase enzyme family protein, partial [Methylobacter sp.]
KVVVKADKQRSALDYRRIRSYSSPVRLVDYLSRHSATINPNELNRIKCQVLDVYFALKKGQKLTIETDPQLWLYTPAGAGQVIFPYNAVSSDKTSADKLYSIWSNLLARLQLGFIKPSKTAFPAAVQEPLRQQIDEVMRREAAAFAAVDKIYVMGSVNRKELGRYEAPFVHGKMAKLGSDVDILIEINPEREGDIPPSWHFINPEASNHCAVYHVAEIPLPDGAGDWPTLHPNMDFIQHLIDAYVFFPSRGFHEEKEAFLRKFGAKLFYDRTRDGTFYRNEEEERIATCLKQIHAFPSVVVEKMKVSTENAIFKVFVDNTPYILKLFKVAGNYSSSRIAEHTAYEENLVRQLKQRGIATAGIVHAPAAMDTIIEGFPALLFERIPGQVQQRPEYPLDKICAALAAIHQVQLEQPLTLDSPFHYEDTCMIWLPTFHTYLQDAPSYSPDIAQAFSQLAPLADNCHPGENRGFLFARSPSLHSHGDVTPKNVISMEQGDTCFFDFNNAFYGSRIIDVIDGAFEFSLAEKYIDLADFSRFDAFIAQYTAHNPLLPEEQEDLSRWLELIGIIKFTKEIRVLLQRPKEDLRRRRALAIAEFVLSRVANAKS